MSADLAELLAGSEWREFLAVDSAGLQLPSFVAVASALKPAMDMWVHAARWSAFPPLARRFGLVFRVDGCFDRNAPVLDRLPPGSITTTRAAFSRNLATGTEAHVFVARSAGALHAAAASGWYPLVVGDRLVEKHRADHSRFGAALGYPACCRDFFLLRNNWECDNSYYAAWKATIGAPQALANGFLRHTSWSYIAHLPCSLACAGTMRYAATIRDVLMGSAPAYAAEIDRRSRSPLLCLSELRIYRFEGSMCGAAAVDYEEIEAVNPTRSDDPLAVLLRLGNRVEVEGCVVRVSRRGETVAAYRARADRHGPEFPFVTACVGNAD